MAALPARADANSHADSASRKRTREIAALCAELDSLHADIQRVAAESSSLIDGVPPNYRESARNLIHYLALHRHDLRALQPKLSALGLSSLGRSEARVLASVAAVRTES